jgi:GNAT superfamily N-acetyltransferase
MRIDPIQRPSGIRPARLPADEQAILSFINGLQDYEAAFEPDRRRDPDFSIEHWRDLQRRHAEKQGIILIAEDFVPGVGGRPVGWAFAYDETAELFVVEPERRHGLVAELYVMPEARGKGLGRALIQGCEDWARSRGHKLLTVGVLAKNPAAIRAYEGAGYAPYWITMRRYL